MAAAAARDPAWAIQAIFQCSTPIVRLQVQHGFLIGAMDLMLTSAHCSAEALAQPAASTALLRACAPPLTARLIGSQDAPSAQRRFATKSNLSKRLRLNCAIDPAQSCQVVIARPWLKI